MIYHIISRTAWQDAEKQGAYRPQSLAHEGFIHFSKLAQVVATAQRFYANGRDLLLLEVDDAKLTHTLLYERATDVADDFPHLYGALNWDAVVGVYAFSADSDGIFHLPTDLRT